MVKPSLCHWFQGIKYHICTHTWFIKTVKCSNIRLQKLSNGMFERLEMCLWTAVFVSEQDCCFICLKWEVSVIKMSVIMSKFISKSITDLSLVYLAYLQSKMSRYDMAGMSVRKTKQDNVLLTCFEFEIYMSDDAFTATVGFHTLISWKISVFTFPIKQCMGLITGKAGVSVCMVGGGGDGMWVKESSLYQFIASASEHSNRTPGSC